jgi:hypothetical protein
MGNGHQLVSVQMPCSRHQPRLVPGDCLVLPFATTGSVLALVLHRQLAVWRVGGHSRLKACPVVQVPLRSAVDPLDESVSM